MPKRLIVCCDGTWYSADKGADNLPSNVARLSRMIARHGTNATGEKIEQIVYYLTGVGTGHLNVLDSVTQGATGAGLDENVVTAYHFLATNYAEGDEIFTFGFSRGAYTARALAGCLTEMGLLRADFLECFREVYLEYKAHSGAGTLPAHKHTKDPNAPYISFRKCDEWKISPPEAKACLQKVNVKVVGVWDTVGSLGLPDSGLTWATGKLGLNNNYEFHDTALNDRVENAFHALALDEHRGTFTPTMWYLDPNYGKNCNLKQCWFPGYHADVGGGTTAGKVDESSIDEVALAWMCDQVDGLLTFNKEAVYKYLDKKEDKNYDAEDWGRGVIKDPISMVYKLNSMGGDVLRTPGQYHKNLKELRKRVGPDFATNESMHPLLKHRMEEMGKKYDPPALKEHGGVRYEKSPGWLWQDNSETGQGAVWIRPQVPEVKGYVYGSWPFQREVRIQEWVIRDKPGKLNMESLMLPKTIKAKLDRRNRAVQLEGKEYASRSDDY